MRKKDWGRAVECLEQADALRSEDIPLSLSVCRSYLFCQVCSRNQTEVLSRWAALCGQNPDLATDVGALLLFAEAQFTSNDCDGALATLKVAKQSLEANKRQVPPSPLPNSSPASSKKRETKEDLLTWAKAVVANNVCVIGACSGNVQPHTAIEEARSILSSQDEVDPMGSSRSDVGSGAERANTLTFYNHTIFCLRAGEVVEACSSWLQHRKIPLNLSPDEYSRRFLSALLISTPPTGDHVIGRLTSSHLDQMDILCVRLWSKLVSNQRFAAAIGDQHHL